MDHDIDLRARLFAHWAFKVLQGTHLVRRVPIDAVSVIGVAAKQRVFGLGAIQREPANPTFSAFSSHDCRIPPTSARDLMIEFLTHHELTATTDNLYERAIVATSGQPLTTYTSGEPLATQAGNR